MTAAANGQGKLLFGHNDFDTAVGFVDNHFRDFGGLEGVDDEGPHIFCVRNDVDTFALQLVDNCLNAGAAHTNAGPDRIDGAVRGVNRDFRARAGVAGDRDDLDNAFIDFRNFLGEKLRHELRMGAGKEDL